MPRLNKSLINARESLAHTLFTNNPTIDIPSIQIQIQNTCSGGAMSPVRLCQIRNAAAQGLPIPPQISKAERAAKHLAAVAKRASKNFIYPTSTTPT